MFQAVARNAGPLANRVAATRAVAETSVAGSASGRRALCTQLSAPVAAMKPLFPFSRARIAPSIAARVTSHKRTVLQVAAGPAGNINDPDDSES